MRRYIVGCAGQFVLGAGLREYDDLDTAIVDADENGPPGAEVYDQIDRRWMAVPTCREDGDEARARIAARASS